MTSHARPEGGAARHGRLYLVPAPLDFGCDSHVPLAEVMPQGTLAVAARLTHWICENAKSARAYLKRVDALVPLALPLQAQSMAELPHQVHKKGDHAGAPGAGFDARPLLAAALNGHDMGLLSEAGMPAVADPGSSVVRAAHDMGLQVVPLTGPVSVLLALAASGLNGQNFAFVGYLPLETAERARRIRELESVALKTGQTQLFIETPYRNQKLFKQLCITLPNQSWLSIACGLTSDREWVKTNRMAQWKKEQPVLDKLPAVFVVRND